MSSVLSADYMRHALSLAKLALGYAKPYPSVGAIVVKNNVVVGMGHTQLAGSEHAEVMAISQAGDMARGATLHTIWEPACYYRNGPPCTQVIIDAGIAEVHVATLNPDPLVSGRGIVELERAGIKTYVGEYRKEACEINEAYIKLITTGLPFVTVNFVMSLDGKIATRGRQSLWPSGEKAREILYDLWHAVDVIMVGSKTVVADGLYAKAKSCRGRGGAEKKQPLCLIVDSKGKISSKSRVFEKPGDKSLAVMRYVLNDEKKREISKKGVEVLEIQGKDGHLDLRELLLELGRRKLSTVLVKGGGNLFGALFDRGLVDKIVVSILPVIVGGNRARTAVGGEGARLLSEVTRLKDVQVKEIDGNIMTSGYVEKRDVHRDS